LNYTTTFLLLILIVISLYFLSFRSQGKSEYDITTNQVQEMIADKDSLVLLDVRTHKEFIGEEGHIPGAILIPLGELKSRMDELEKFRDQEMIVICSSGSRSGSATRYLRKNGFVAFNMEGGMQAWNKLSDNLTNDSMGTVHEKATE
jgi:rhodanese-related sulfurtransferase